ncbi:MucB/RseB C-terminal domain-containing protein [Pseudidiomarina sp. 1APP75-32.1]|uniref:MucB/RseB C-terminal domain-containing protein n=2 Tax=Pseudidiomarina terrestris TaxID=2820060 RepID=A0AAW7QTH3_9GAMM|nr:MULTISPECIES: MucB/RseB C-terminal domain-containing protein [unclassified Pseudidiomarina]MDN7123581.1 MucB/RseB C-terminal domain-containing protein [Pseudidiomarina sp. 1APP75-32.1]MDN7128695.1 MucB/RseB C-terminal domain-containing protein [Pseudidiomarina sp. 1APR75-15]MDN7135046.1 MucB/RseB C-terminal domain-containing protein [Pseudidiomarina sp. 1ASP75-5]
MTNKIWRGSLAGLLMLGSITPLQVVAQTPAVQAPASSAEYWFNQMSTALRELNFEATLVKSSGARLEPMTWLHGVYEDGLEVELVVRLNGADVRSVRIGDDTSYYSQPSDSSYTLHSDVTYGLLPAAFYQPFEQLQPHYQVLVDRGMRVTGRATYFLRILSRDNDRYHYGLWIDRKSGMLLKMQMTTPQGEVLEQIQLTTFTERESMPISLSDLRGVPRPPRLHEIRNQEPPQFTLEPTWMPAGFELLRSSHRRVAETRLPTDYFLYTDGLTEVSVYVSNSQQQALPELALQGPESLFNLNKGDFAITVVGKLPVGTLQRIAESMQTAN